MVKGDENMHLDLFSVLSHGIYLMVAQNKLQSIHLFELFCNWWHSVWKLPSILWSTRSWGDEEPVWYIADVVLCDCQLS